MTEIRIKLNDELSEAVAKLESCGARAANFAEARSRAAMAQAVLKRAEELVEDSKAEARRLRRVFQETMTEAAREEAVQAEVKRNMELDIVREVRRMVQHIQDQENNYAAAMQAVAEMRELFAAKKAREAERAAMSEADQLAVQAGSVRHDEEADARLLAEYAAEDAEELKKFETMDNRIRIPGTPER